MLKNWNLEDFIEYRHLLLLTGVYFCAHGFLLILTGRWWDDWCFVGLSSEELYKWAMQMGRPSVIVIGTINSYLPENAYKIITFVLFYINGFFVYGILRNSLCLGKSDCFWISLLYIVVPAYDVRVIWAVFPYTVGFSFFLAAFFLLTYVVRSKSIIIRGITLILFTMSFSLNSCLAFYAVPLIYLLYHEKTIFRMQYWIDFLFLPVIFLH